MTLLLDLAALAIVGLAILRGWRLGASGVLARCVGLVLGVLTGLWLAARLISERLSPVAHLLLGVLIVLGCAAIGGRVVVALTARLVRAPGASLHGSGAGSLNRIAGAVLRGLLAGGVCSLALGLVAGLAPSSWAAAARASQVGAAFAPAGSALRAVGTGALDLAPADIAALVPATSPTPPNDAVARALAARVGAGVVEVLATGCGQDVQGTGFVAGDGVVVTNSHVVRGSGPVQIQTVDGQRLDATVVAFVPASDLAVLYVSGLDAPALPIGDDAANGSQAVVIGYPGGVRTITPAAVIERLPLPGSSTLALHQAYVIDAPVRHGNSGSPLLDLRGHVVGVVNALSTADPGAGFATTATELTRVLTTSTGHLTAVPTGTCTTTKGT